MEATSAVAHASEQPAAPAQSAAALTYGEGAIENAPPIVVVRRLYEGALRFLERSTRAAPESPAFAEGLLRADAIVVELRLALAHELAPEIARELERLYGFIEERIRQSLRERNPAPIAEAQGVLERLLAAWSSLALAPA